MLEDLIADRRGKLDRYARSRDPYPATVRRNRTIGQAIERFDDFVNRARPLTLVGRVVGMRDQGKILFLDVRDATGQIQFVCDKEQTTSFSLLQSSIDIGDFVEGRGLAFLTKRGEKSIQARSARIVTKALRPLPLGWTGLEDAETRLRKRYLDFLSHPETADLFKKKAVFWSTVRGVLSRSGFLEVETPVLESVPGGAEAEPFVTHHRALDRDFYLRISLELPLKKMLVGGFEKVFEIGRIFRNEGIDREHLQDYTQMECYAAYSDYKKMMRFVEKLFQTTIQKTIGSLDHSYQGHELHWGGTWPIIDYFDAFRERTGIDLSNVPIDTLRSKAAELGIPLEQNTGRGRAIDAIYKRTVRPHLIQPSFLVDPPVDVEPLAKRLPKNPDRVARFQVVAGGTELGKGFSELNDPLDQRRRFEEQMRLREAGDAEAQRLDESFLEALEYGMPPAAGFGMSERLFAVLVDRPVRETVIFPPMKEES